MLLLAKHPSPGTSFQRSQLDLVDPYVSRLFDSYQSTLAILTGISARILETANEDKKRQQAFLSLAAKEYRMDLISGNLVEHVIDRE